LFIIGDLFFAEYGGGKPSCGDSKDYGEQTVKERILMRHIIDCGAQPAFINGDTGIIFAQRYAISHMNDSDIIQA
jgi:hypothetical protein